MDQWRQKRPMEPLQGITDNGSKESKPQLTLLPASLLGQEDCYIGQSWTETKNWNIFAIHLSRVSLSVSSKAL